MGDRVVAHDDCREPTREAIGEPSQIGGRKGDCKSACRGLLASALDGSGRKIRRGDTVAELGETQRLGTDPAGGVENVASGRYGKLVEHMSEPATLAADARIPVRVEQVIIRGEGVVEFLSHP